MTIATPESQGLNGDRLNQAVTKITQGNYGDINSLLVIRNNYLVLEKYFSPQYYGPEYLYTVRSVTKSISSALIGIAIEQGKIKGVHSKLLDFFPEYNNIANLDDRKRSITLENVLTMTAGFRWDELASGYADPINEFNTMVASQDWIKYVLDLPMRDIPGAKLEYNSGCSILLSAILVKVTGQSVEEYADEYLFKPLGFGKWSWSLGPRELTNTGWGLALTRRDMARFGLLFLNDGRWQDKQVISKKWRQESTKEHIKGAQDDFIYSNFGYGYQWWRFLDHDPVVSNLKVNDVYLAYGDGSQVILVVPHLNMVVVSTGELHGEKFRLFFNMLRDDIFPAVLD